MSDVKCVDCSFFVGSVCIASSCPYGKFIKKRGE